jgi:hypothetical protein
MVSESNREAAMESRVIARERWAGYLAATSKALEGNRVRIEVTSLAQGAQRERPRVLVGLTYDPEADEVVFRCADGDHRVAAPTEVASGGEGAGVKAIAVTDAQGAVHMVRVVAMLGLPSQ